MSNYKIIDNFLNKDEFKIIKDTFLLDNKFPWYYSDVVSHYNKDDDGFYFEHHFYNKYIPLSNWFNVINSLILSKLDINALIRVKGNLYSKTEKVITHDMHVDYDIPHKGALYSLNTCNGFTTLEDGTKIESIANRLLLFDSSKLHCSSTCTDQKRRVNFNINYL